MNARTAQQNIPYPVRINRYLALKGIATRRGAEKYILEGKVLINGKPAELGSKVLEGDVVSIKALPKRSFRYFAYHKPRGIITHSPKGREQSIGEVSGLRGVYPVGRLDKDSEGLIILTDDGRITERLLSPRFEHEKEYMVTIQESVRPEMFRKLSSGVMLDDGPAKAVKISARGSKSFSITITEGRKHQVRRMVSAVNGTAVGLKRVRIMNIDLGKLASGDSRPIEGKELEKLLSDLGLAR